MTPERLEAVLRYCRLEDFFDDPAVTATVTQLHDAAAAYLRDAGIRRTERTASRFDLAAAALTLHYYDQRGGIVVGTSVVEPPLGLRSLINQLKLTALACPGEVEVTA